ncbi:SDR family oxidoreductase [Methylopila sp. Yamaguchi]|uniref:SDR family oxidoreductase n=1 Tax=Methylopila sp. Yamaguchi TaxID=1437817 RepID=UPI000CC84848|nr:SDR family oxidoreductase [Methylopila sp. Yamaguchi]GBD50421.1 oxidoreductase [Methylopila sp. Yamaguchi]
MTYPTPPFPRQSQSFPGKTSGMNPKPDHGETSYRGSDRLAGKKAIITGGDSGIGLAVAIAFAREGADLVIVHLPDEAEDAAACRALIEEAGRKAVMLPGDVGDAGFRAEIVERAVSELGGLDVLVNNAAYQKPYQSIEEITLEEWEKTFAVNVHAYFHLAQLSVARMGAGGSIINTASINSKDPTPMLLPYAATKGAIANMTLGLAGLLGERGIRVNAVLPGPIWTPFIPAGMPPEAVETFGSKTPMGRPGQPAELASAYVMLASDESSYTSGALITVAGGQAVL